ncbi:MAG: hypothetical protein Q8L71_01375 [Thiobacillus sp.]|nr:hypothetical protein [Thiobacillus sp.]
MKLVKNMRWAVIAASILSGPALAAIINCTVAPTNSIITEGQTLQLSATCDGALSAINWKMGTVSVTGDVALSGHIAGIPVYYTTPVGLAATGSSEFTFSVTGTPVSGTDTFGSTTSTAKVVVKSSSAAIAQAQGVINPTTPVDAQCGTAQGGATTSMPANGAQCASGSKAALAISGPDSFTWSCISLTGGAEASCYALRGYTVTATAGANGSVSPLSQGVNSGATATITATPNSGYSAAISGCGGSQSGNNFTTGPVTANCTVTASFTNAPINGACGTASNSTPVTSAPSANLCSTGSASVVTTNSTNYTWSCNGANGGSNATSCQAPRGYTVTTTAGSNGTISASKDVAGGTTTTFTVTPANGYAATVSGCGGSLSGNTYTTGAITSACTVSASFAVQTVSTTDPGTGLWIPPNTTGRVIADQSGSTSQYTTSYVPGCLNGENITSSSSSGCGVKTSFTGTVNGTSTQTTFAYGSGSTLGLRYTSKSGAGATAKYFTLASGDGGNVGQALKVWLSDSPTATYETTAALCRTTSTQQPYVITGPGYCPIVANKQYYLFSSTDAVGTNFRYLVNEGSADFY